MRNFTWNQFPIKNLLIDSLLTPIVESTYLNRDMCKFESCKKTKADGSRLIARKHSETLVLLTDAQLHLNTNEHLLPSLEKQLPSWKPSKHEGKHTVLETTIMGGGTILKVGGPKTVEYFCGLNRQLWRHNHWKWHQWILSACNFMQCFIRPSLPLSALHLRYTDLST